MYHTISLTAKVGSLSADPDLGVRLLEELERIEAAGVIAAPVTAQGMQDGTVSATVCVDGAASAMDALRQAQDAFASALLAATGGTVRQPVYSEIQVVEEREEAATIA